MYLVCDKLCCIMIITLVYNDHHFSVYLSNNTNQCRDNHLRINKSNKIHAVQH